MSSVKSSFNKKEIYAWKQSFGFLNNQTLTQHTRKTLSDGEKNKLVKVTTALVEPFVMIKVSFFYCNCKLWFREIVRSQMLQNAKETVGLKGFV